LENRQRELLKSWLSQLGITMKLPRRQFLHLAAGATVLPALPRLAHAQAYPTRPITVLVFVGAGGTPDIIARVVGQALTQRLGQSMLVDNRPGAGGNLALQAVARAPADGYTLLQVATPHSINVTLYEKSPVNVMRDIVPIAGTNYDSFVMMVHPSFPAKTVPEFIAYANANPGKVNLASSGTANLSHLSAELFRMPDQHPVGSRAVPGHASSARGAVGQRSAGHVRCRWIGAAANPVWRIACGRGIGHQPDAGAAGCSADRRIRPRLRGHGMARLRRA
jgi:hypothetical protein